MNCSGEGVFHTGADREHDNHLGMSFVFTLIPSHVDFSVMPFMYMCESKHKKLNSDPHEGKSLDLIHLCPAAVLGAPLVEVNVKQNYMNITIKGPFRWRTRRTKKDKSLLKFFPHMIYNVSVFNSRSNHTVSARQSIRS